MGGDHLKKFILLLLNVALGMNLCFCTCNASSVDYDYNTTKISKYVDTKDLSIKKAFKKIKKLGKKIHIKVLKGVCEVISRVDPSTENKINKVLRPILNDMCGFVYDPEKDIYYTREDSFQKYFGFGDFFDECSPALGMNIDELPIVFRYKNGNNPEQEWLIELWKGQYASGLSTGAEIGIYNRVVEDDMIEYKKGKKNYIVFFESAKGKDKMHLSYTLYGKDGKFILDGNSSEYPKPLGEDQDKDWWLLRIKFGEYNDKKDLKMDAEIEFLDEEMAKEFTRAVKEQYSEEIKQIERNGSIVKFYWGK